MEDENFDKNIVSANQMIGELLKNIIIIWFIFFLLYRIIYVFVVNALENFENHMLLAFTVIIIQTIIVSLTLGISNKRVLKKNTVYKEEVSIVIKAISFVIIIVLVLQVLGTFASVNSTIDKEINTNMSLKYQEYLYSMFYSDTQMEKYQSEKAKAIEELKGQMYLYLSVVEIGICSVYIAAVLIERKTLYNNAIEKAV